MSLNQIGDFEFIAIHGEPLAPREQLDVIQRPGVDGTGFLQIGRRGEPFELLTMDDAETRQIAEDMLVDYRALITQTPVSLTRSGVTYPWLVQVLDVQAAAISDLLGSAGGRHPPSAAVVRARWRLVAVDTPAA